MKEFEALTLLLLQAKYEYYVTFFTNLSDYEYDELERKWDILGRQLGIDMDNYPHWVGFDEKHPLAHKVNRE